MNETTASSRRWPTGVLGALVLIAVVELIVGGHELDFMTPPRLEWRQSAEASTREALTAQVLALGTSMTKLGFYPSVVERESGRSAYNLASCAGRLPGAYSLLRRALKAGAKPEAIVLEVHPIYLALPFQEGLAAWPDLLEPLDCLDLAWSSGDASFFASTILTRTLPSLNGRAEIRAAVLAWFRGEVGSTRSNTLPHLRNLELNAGAFVRRREFPFCGEVDPYLANMYLPPAWSSDHLNERYLRRILDLCTSKNIQVYWLIPPLVPELQARREQAGHDATYTRFTRKIQRNYPQVVVLDVRHSGYEPKVFSDAAHLDLEGAKSLSAEIGRIIKAGPLRTDANPGWVNLPPYRPWQNRAPLEDIAQSYRAIGEANSVKR